MPERFDLTKSVARLLSDGADWRDDKIVPALVEEYEISPARLAIMNPGKDGKPTKRSRFANEVDFAKGELNDRGFVQKVRTKVYRITPLGLDWIKSLTPRK